MSAMTTEMMYAGMGKWTGSAEYHPKRTKFKGYMRNPEYKAKH